MQTLRLGQLRIHPESFKVAKLLEWFSPKKNCDGSPPPPNNLSYDNEMTI